MPFISLLVASPHKWDEGRLEWETKVPLAYKDEDGTIYTVPSGYHTDFAYDPAHLLVVPASATMCSSQRLR